MGDERKRRNRTKLRKWREVVSKAKRQMEWKAREERRKTRERVAKHRQMAEKQTKEEEDTTKTDVARRIVANLRARLDKNRGNFDQLSFLNAASHPITTVTRRTDGQTSGF